MTAYFHGGIPGLAIGSDLLPPSVTGRTDSTAKIARDHFDTDYVREDRVFLGRTVEIASLYAAMYPDPDGGWVYECEPVGAVELDPDYTGDDPSDSVQVERAVVVRVIGPLPRALVEGVRQMLARDLVAS